MFELVGHAGNVMLLCGYTDGWTYWYGALSATFYPTQTTRSHAITTGNHSMPLAGAVSFELVRVGDRTTIYRDGKEFAIWTTTESLAEIRIKMGGTSNINPQGRSLTYASGEALNLRLEGLGQENYGSSGDHAWFQNSTEPIKQSSQPLVHIPTT